jgi:cytochrome P450
MSTNTEKEQQDRRPVQPDYSPFAPEVMADPLAPLARFRRESPVFYSPAASWWIVTRYEDVIAVLMDTDRFSSSVALGDPDMPDEAAAFVPEGDPNDHITLINSNPPEHRRIRKLANQAFNPAAFQAKAPMIDATVSELLDGVAEQGHCDLVADFTVPLPIRVIAEMLGIPRSDTHLIHQWSNASIGVRAHMLDQQALMACWRSIAELTEYLDAMIAERRRNPQSDFISKLVEAREEDGAALTDQEVRGLVAQLIVAGNETTRYLIATMVLRLLQNPDQLREVRENPDLIAPAVEEALRHSGPAKGLLRITTEDVELGGAHIPKGELVFVGFASANHDPSVFDDPDEFDLHRGNLKKHIAFGRGEHFCIGAPLARLEAQIALPAILERLPNLRLASKDPHGWVPSPHIRGLQRLDVRWDVGRRT